MLDFIIALITSALAGTGVGGGGLLVIYLTLVKDMEQLKAQGINIAFFIAGAAASLFIHIRKRHLNFPLMLLIGALGAAGSVLGSLLAEKIGSSLIQKAFGVMLAASGLKTLSLIHISEPTRPY